MQRADADTVEVSVSEALAAGFRSNDIVGKRAQRSARKKAVSTHVETAFCLCAERYADL